MEEDATLNNTYIHIVQRHWLASCPICYLEIWVNWTGKEVALWASYDGGWHYDVFVDLTDPQWCTQIIVDDVGSYVAAI